MTQADKQYNELVKNILENGVLDENPRPVYKDGTSAHSRFITDIYSKYSENITPIISLRPIAWRTGIREILTIYQKQTNNIREMEDMGVGWWSDWTVNLDDVPELHNIGLRYGATVKKWNLMNKLLDGLVNEPFSRRHIINLYQESDLQETDGLHPCAFLTEWACRRAKDGKMYLDVSLTQRSSDFGTAYSINQIQYKALQMMVACHCGYEVGTFSHHVMNLHIYDRHEEQLKILRDTVGQENEPELILVLPKNTNFYDINVDDFKMMNYAPVKHRDKLIFELAI